jgi:hypothetical protein
MMFRHACFMGLEGIVAKRRTETGSVIVVREPFESNQQ